MNGWVGPAQQKDSGGAKSSATWSHLDSSEPTMKSWNNGKKLADHDGTNSWILKLYCTLFKSGLPLILQMSTYIKYLT